MSRCPNCDTPLHITRAASPVIESDGAHEYRMNAINSAPPKSSEPEKVPTPASDSVKGERDRHGRTIIARNDFAMVVRTDEPEDDLPYLIVDGKSEFYWCYDEWVVETMSDLPRTGFLHRNQAMKALALAAATPLPTANPAASAKPYAFNGPIPSGPSAAEFSDLRLRVGDLEREVAALKAVK